MKQQKMRLVEEAKAKSELSTYAKAHHHFPTEDF